MLAMGCPRPVEPVVEPPIVEVPKPGGTLTFLAVASPDNLDPQVTVMAISFWVFSLMVDTLVAVDHNLEIVPHLAESWEMSEDGLTWTFHLRRGVRFHDGTPFNAEAAAFSFNRYIKVAPGRLLPQLKETVAVDEYTIEMRLTAPAPMLLDVLSGAFTGIISPAAVAKYEDDHGIRNMVGTGPFKFSEFIPGERVVVVRNEEYTWGPGFVKNPGPAYLERIELLVIPEAMTRVMEFEDRVRREDAVTAAIPTGDILRLKADPAIQTLSRPATGAVLLFINTTLWPFDDVRLREALWHAINTKDAIEFVMDGLAAPAYTFISPAQIGYEMAAGPIRPIVRQFNPERARELFAEAGWLPGPDGILVHQETGRRAEFGLLAPSTPPERIAQAEVTKAQLREIGLEIRITILESAAAVARAREGVYELFIVGYSWPDITRGFDLFHTRQIGGLNFSFFSDPQVDRLVEIGFTSLDAAERAAAWNAAHVRILEKAPFVPWWYPKLFAMASTDVGGWAEYLGAHPWWSRVIFALDLHVVR
jgi:peptide/nickel transport system substrate-binding protein